MRPYRHRSLPRQHRHSHPEEQRPPEQEQTVLPEQSAASPELNVAYLLASLLQPSVQQQIQNILPYIASQVGVPPESLPSNAALSERVRIRSAVARRQGGEEAVPGAVWQTLKGASPALDQAAQPDRVAEALKSVEEVRRKFSEIGQGGVSSFLSKQIGEQYKSQSKDAAPLSEMLMSGQSSSFASLLPMLLQGQGGAGPSNQLLPMLMQSQGGIGSLLPALMGGGGGMQGALLAALLQGHKGP